MDDIKKVIRYVVLDTIDRDFKVTVERFHRVEDNSFSGYEMYIREIDLTFYVSGGTHTLYLAVYKGEGDDGEKQIIDTEYTKDNWEDIYSDFSSYLPR